MRTIITLALFLVVGFVGSKGLIHRATHRLPLAGLFATGMEFFILGVVCGPRGLDLITAGALADLEPIVYLSMGWIGLLLGIEISWSHVRKVSPSVFRFLLADTAAFTIVFSAAAYLVLRGIWPGLSSVEQAEGALTFGITAAVSSPTVVALVSQNLPARGSVTNTIRIASALSSLFPLLVFGLLLTVSHSGFSGPSAVVHGLLWWLFVNGVGIVLGFLMVLFTRERTSDNEMLLIIVGTVFLIGGVCYLFELPTLYTALVVGFVVGNFSRKREQVFRELHLIEKTLFVAFLIIVGAMVDLSDAAAIAVIVAFYTVFRLAMKYAVTGTAVVSGSPEIARHGRKVGLALSGQGVMALAIALDYVLSSHETAAASVLAVVAVSVLVSDVSGFAITRWVLRSCDEADLSRTNRSAG